MLQAPLPGEFISQSGTFRLIDVTNGAVMPPMPGQSSPVFESTLGEGCDGIVLPRWGDAIALLQRAHSLFPTPTPIIGWDVLFDGDGPLLCEANIEITCYFFQLASANPMAGSPLGALAEEWLQWHD
jgi:hypothetical protein